MNEPLVTFETLGCPTNFDTRPFLKIDAERLLFRVKACSEGKEADEAKKELQYACEVLANQTDNACTERGEDAVVYVLPFDVKNIPECKPFDRLIEMCLEIGTDFDAYIGYKKYTSPFSGRNFYCPQIQLVFVDGRREETTMYEVFRIRLNEVGLNEIGLNNGREGFKTWSFRSVRK